MIELTVADEHAGLRLDRYLASALPQYSRSRLQALIRAGEVVLQGKSVRTRKTVRAGDVVRLTIPPLGAIDAQAEDIPLEILFEDDDLLILNKPPGLIVHPGAGNQTHTLVNALLHHCTSLSGIGGKLRPGIVHRLDKETSGCLVVAKNDAAHQQLARQFAEREVKKIYLALVVGAFKRPRGTIDAAIGRHPIQRKKMTIDLSRGRAAKTEYRVVQSGDAVSLVECALHSGRTHQIRVHLSAIGHPIVGDATYGGVHRRVPGDIRAVQRLERPFLHAARLVFTHPVEKRRMEFTAPLPSDLMEILDDLPGWKDE